MQNYVCDVFSYLNTEHNFVTHVGKRAGEAEAVWEDIAPRAVVEGCVPGGRASGRGWYPAVRLRDVASTEMVYFVRKSEDVFRVPAAP